MKARRRLALALLCLLLGGCQSVEPANDGSLPRTGQPVRFLLTFDDGPSISPDFNPTVSIQQQLAANDLQPGIKAIFFVQTRNRNGGGTAAGREILRRENAAGHVIGLHSGSARGHIRHTKMTPQELDQSLDDGKADIRAITGHDPEFIRPTFWGYNARTQAAYEAHHLKMLLTDVNGHDGIIHVFDFKLDPRGDFHAEMVKVRAAMEHERLPAVHGVVPVVVSFHDVNAFTAHHLTEYLHILVAEARRVGLPVAPKPFYDSAAEITEAAAKRAVPPPQIIRSPRAASPDSRN